jgi:hypothetical protein
VPQEDNQKINPNYCNCSLADGEKLHPPTCRSRSHENKEMLWRKVQETTMKNPSGRMFFPKYATLATSFVAVVHGNTALRGAADLAGSIRFNGSNLQCSNITLSKVVSESRLLV